ncbi:hypothetical protein EFP95_05390 [Lentilactobacillus hilgardii]|nr:hypothetical protein [Lentilactobacillus hilgardii]
MNKTIRLRVIPKIERIRKKLVTMNIGWAPLKLADRTIHKKGIQRKQLIKLKMSASLIGLFFFIYLPPPQVLLKR